MKAASGARREPPKAKISGRSMKRYAGSAQGSQRAVYTGRRRVVSASLRETAEPSPHLRISANMAVSWANACGDAEFCRGFISAEEV